MAEQNENIEQNIRLNFDTNANEITQQVDSLTDAVDSSTDSVSDNTAETKKNEQAQAKLAKQLEDAAKELAKMVQLHGATSREAINAAKAVSTLEAQLSKTADNTRDLNATFEQVYGELQPLTTRMGEAEDRLYELALAGQEASEEYQGLLNVVGEYRRTQILTDRAVDAAAATFKDKLGAATQIAATGINFAAGAIGAFSDDSEEATKVIQKMQAAMAFAEGLKGIAELGEQFKIVKGAIIAAAAATELDSAAEKRNIIQKAISATATGILTAAQWAYNIALAANPVVAIALAVAALTAGIWLLVSALAANEAAEQKQIKTAQDNEKAQKKLTEARKESVIVLERNQKLSEDLAKASGKSAIEINKLANAHINEASALSQKNAQIAKQNFLRERSILLELKENDASEEALNAQKSAMLNAYEELQDYNKKTNDLKVKRIELNNQFLVDETQKETDARKKASDEALKAQQDADKKKQDAAAKAAQALLELKKKNLEDLKNAELKAFRENQDQNATTAQEKLDIAKERDLLEIEALAKKGEDVTNLMAYNTEKYNTLQNELDAADKETKLKADKDYWAAQADAASAAADKDKEIADKKLAIKKAEQDSINALGNAALTAGKDLFAKNKAVQKGIIAADGAVALGKVAINTVQAVAADNAASPLTFGLPWSAVHIATGALGAASIIANTSKALSAVGGGSAGSAPAMPSTPTAGGGETRTQATATPQVSFQASSENQIASTIARNTNAQPVIKTYVVASEVADQQALDRKKVEANSF
ncbi:hypothetical protein GKZ90_0021065 [Flavobacterium sp. MC2016-06]|uniref:hypothetical protein n=1 Tax=Flavobacterium sp. MC2016-06 TaxID=2676308 RepID=UPI0012BB15EC|nr:hypothetical protein [Flavobacterium sp. MC2016-06]MBU3860992.1 hypothetical protein [Flavobacterium sp. MC2016-06]